MAIVNNPYANYNQTKVTTVSRGDLLIMLYDGAIRFIREMIDSMESNNIQKRVSASDSALAIINELKMSINPEYNPQLANNLMNIYNFCTRTITNSNLNNKSEDLKPLVLVLEELKAGWEEAAKMEKAKAAGTLSDPKAY